MIIANDFTVLRVIKEGYSYRHINSDTVTTSPRSEKVLHLGKPQVKHLFKTGRLLPLAATTGLCGTSNDF